MSVSRVLITPEVLQFCLFHALQTDREEVMGLLLGDITNSSSVCIWSASVLIRSDKQPDRVEISPEQLSKAHEEADACSALLGIPTRVVGWYHSHPRITAPPSHIDLRTQYSYQAMDENFFGLIVSCFNHNANDCTGRIDVIGFRSVYKPGPNDPEVYSPGSTLSCEYIPINVISSSKLPKTIFHSRVLQLQELQLKEEKDAFEESLNAGDDDLSAIHKISSHQRNLTQLLNHSVFPPIKYMADRNRTHREKVESLRKQYESLLQQRS